MIRVIPIASESLGVRSLCTFVEAKGYKILLDPGAALGVRRRLMPHKREFEALLEAKKKIIDYASKADYIFISHYHHDHYSPFYADYMFRSDEEIASMIYENAEKVFAKSLEDLNKNQLSRAKDLRKHLEGKIEPADNRVVKISDDLVLEFSPPLRHGEPGTKLGKVVAVRIINGEDVIVFAPDVQGPVDEEAMRWILKKKPRLIIVGGPATYLKGHRVKSKAVDKAIENVRELAKRVDTIIIDHHIVRDPKRREKLSKAFEEAEKRKHKILTFAQYLGVEERPLEAMRKKLYEEEPLPEGRHEFIKKVKKRDRIGLELP